MALALSIDPEASPRLITVLAPETAISLQDLVDLLRDWEDEPINMDYPPLISAAGKENLGGGVTVGITATLLNARLAFESRTIPQETGTATSTDPGTRIIDSTATFISNGVELGATVVNYTTMASATILELVSETELRSTPLSGGTRGDWQIGDSYGTYNTVQCNISGGNLVAVDDLAADLDPVFPTAFTQIVKTSSSSATLQELADIQYSSFAGGIWYDADNGVSGIAYPTGTERRPVDNFIDALAIANERGFNTFYVIGDATIDAGLNYTNYVFHGQGQNLSTFTVASAANVTNCTFLDALVTGTLDGDSHIENCIIEDLDFISGVLEFCMLNPGTITLGGSATAHFLDCKSGIPGIGTPIIDCGGSGQALALRNYNGGIRIQNKTGAEDISIDLNSGQVILDASVVSGSIVVRGVGKITDNSSGADVYQELVSGLDMQTVLRILRNKLITDPATGIMTVYDDDHATELLTANIFEDAAGTQPYRGQGVERREYLTPAAAPLFDQLVTDGGDHLVTDGGDNLAVQD